MRLEAQSGTLGGAAFLLAASPQHAIARLSAKPHQGLARFDCTVHQGHAPAISNTATGLAACWYDSGTGSRSTGKERDAETGLDYLLARYYSPAMGRFTSPDEWAGGAVDPFTGGQVSQPGPLPYADITNPQTLNKYAYVMNNPLRYTDPDGHLWKEAAVAVEEVVETSVATSFRLIGGLTLGFFTFTGGQNANHQAEFERLIGQGVKPADAAEIVLQPRSNPQSSPQEVVQPTAPSATPGQPSRTSPTPQGAEHKKGARKSTKDKHEAPRPGRETTKDRLKPDFKKHRDYVQPKPPKPNQPTPPKKHTNKYKKEDGTN